MSDTGSPTLGEHRALATFAQEVAERAGALIKRLREERTIEEFTKDGGSELVTSADLASNEIIREATSRRTPGAQYFSEEGDAVGVAWSQPAWVVDPIDGTVNYVYGHPHVSIAIAYVVQGEVQVGVVHAPFQGETFVAVRGEGATRNGIPIGNHRPAPLARALVSTGFPHNHRGMDTILARLTRVMSSCRDIRRLASAAIDICWVAAGRLDAAYETLRPWDVAASGLVARECGVLRGHYDTHSDEPPELCGENVVFAGQGLFDELLRVLRAER
jgi:myo-inositol-1(or 4)-monophosphatase